MTTISQRTSKAHSSINGFHHAPGTLLQVFTCAGRSDNKQQFVSSWGHSHCNRVRGKRFWFSTDGSRKGRGSRLGNRRGKSNKRDENTRVPDLRSATHQASGDARYTFAWNILCTVILGTISHPVDDDADGPAPQVRFPSTAAPIEKSSYTPVGGKLRRTSGANAKNHLRV